MRVYSTRGGASAWGDLRLSSAAATNIFLAGLLCQNRIVGRTLILVKFASAAALQFTLKRLSKAADGIRNFGGGDAFFV